MRTSTGVTRVMGAMVVLTLTAALTACAQPASPTGESEVHSHAVDEAVGADPATDEPARGLPEEVPADLDTRTERTTEADHFVVSYGSEVSPVPVNQLHRWTLEVSTPDGEAVEEAIIGVDGDMPQHGHGMPTAPRVTEDMGGGRYMVEGMKFQMPGWWTVTVEVIAGDARDVVTFNLMLH